MDPKATSPVLFFDGECNLCNKMVQFVLRHDKKKIFLFCPLQSERGKAAIAEVSAKDKEKQDSFILFYKGRYFSRSTAALLTSRLLGGLWALLYAGIIIPRFLRDGVYNFVSRNRYKWFGKRDSCMVPTPDIMSRFLV